MSTGEARDKRIHFFWGGEENIFSVGRKIHRDKTECKIVQQKNSKEIISFKVLLKTSYKDVQKGGIGNQEDKTHNVGAAVSDTRRG